MVRGVIAQSAVFAHTLAVEIDPLRVRLVLQKSQPFIRLEWHLITQMAFESIHIGYDWVTRWIEWHC